MVSLLNEYRFDALDILFSKDKSYVRAFALIKYYDF